MAPRATRADARRVSARRRCDLPLTANLAGALLEPDTLSQPAWVWFVAWARGALARGKRLFLSSENFASVAALPAKTQLLISTLRMIGFGKLRVVIVHRRCYEKLQSEHSEQFLADYRTRADVSEYLPIVDWVTQREPYAENKFGQTVMLRAHFERLGAEVSVLDIHRVPPSDFVATFVCEHMRAASTCGQLRAHPNSAKVGKKNARPRGAALLVDVIYGAAAQRGMARLSCPRALQALYALGADWRPELAIQARCLSEPELARVWRFTAAEEADLLRRPLSALEASELRKDFDAKAGGFCSANVSAVLASVAWAKPLAIALKRGSEMD